MSLMWHDPSAAQTCIDKLRYSSQEGCQNCSLMQTLMHGQAVWLQALGNSSEGIPPPSVQVMWMLSAKVSEDIFKKQLERLAGAVANHLQQLQQGIFTVQP